MTMKTRRTHYWALFSVMRAAIWAAMIPIAYFTNWIYSVAFVAVCSLYANLASDFAAWRADDNPQLEHINDKLTEILEKLDNNG